MTICKKSVTFYSITWTYPTWCCYFCKCYITASKYVGSEDSHQGDIIYYGTGTTVAGKLYYLKNTGAWGAADASQAASATSLLAIAAGTDPATDGMLVRGIYHSPQGDLGTIADILYISTTAGNVNRVKPSSTGQIVRVVGYVLDNTVGLMWFDPDKTWIELWFIKIEH